MTAATAGLAAAAFSLDVRSPRADGDAGEYWETASAVAERMLPGLHNLRPGVVLNVNVPNVPPGRLRGIRPGTLAPAGAVQVSVVESATGYLQVTMAENTEPSAPGTDSLLLTAGYASVTPFLAVCDLPGEDFSWLPVGLAPERADSGAERMSRPGLG